MPELPEVETVAQGLRKILVKRRIIAVRCSRSRLRYPLNKKFLNEVCRDHILQEIKRYGKYMIWLFSSEKALIVHLGMSGRFRWVKYRTPLKQHEHVRFVLEDKSEVRYEDPRRFGCIVPVKNHHWQNHPLISKLGPDPTESIKASYLHHRAQGRSSTVKQFLMDQSVVVGLGNIYVVEVLFRASIHPYDSVSNLTLIEWKRICRSISTVFDQAIKAGGTTLEDSGFINIAGDYGQFQADLFVYGRYGEKCRRCDAVIERAKNNNRYTYFCPYCQRIQ